MQPPGLIANSIFIDTELNIQKILICDINGKVIKNISIIPESKIIELSELNIGVYLISIYDKSNNVSRFKIVKQQF